MKDISRRIIHRLIEKSGHLCPDEIFLRILFRLYLGKNLNLKNPSTFNEKLQWLKLNYHPEGLHEFVDKLSAKIKAKERCPNVGIIPTIGLWKNPDEIDFDSLPERFILKPTHGGGGNVWICRNKEDFDQELCRKWCRKALKTDIYARYREYPYKDISPAILAEPLIGSGGAVSDYKFFCFDGVPRFLKVDTDRFISHHADYLDMEFNPVNISELSYPPAGVPLNPPDCFSEMKEMARILSYGFPFVRIDLYEDNGKIFFGEFTFFPRSGLGELYPDTADRMIGDMLKLPASKE